MENGGDFKDEEDLGKTDFLPPLVSVPLKRDISPKRRQFVGSSTQVRQIKGRFHTCPPQSPHSFFKDESEQRFRGNGVLNNRTSSPAADSVASSSIVDDFLGQRREDEDQGALRRNI